MFGPGPPRGGAVGVVLGSRRRTRLRSRRDPEDAAPARPFLLMSRTDETARGRLAVALDLPDRAQLLAMVRRVAPEAGLLKLGLEAFVAEGPSLVREVARAGAGIFLDLKLHDIPNTVSRAAAAAVRTGASDLPHQGRSLGHE